MFVNSVSNASGLVAAKSLKNADKLNFQGSEIIKGCFDDEAILNKNKSVLTKAQKQEILRSSLQSAAGWGIVFGVFSTLYYGLRSDNTVAKKYNLDPKADASLIKKIKSNQVLWTLPGALLPIAGGLAAWLFAMNRDASKMDV